MTPSREGSFRLFRFAGIDVFLHWSWFLVAWYQISRRAGDYSSIKWNILEYVGLFGMVLMHEFGHALACRQVGGQADQIVLWPLGGVAYVRPPSRPGATLWSIAAGPLVNVMLLPIIAAVWFAASKAGLKTSSPDVYKFITAVGFINFGLLAFNILPIYPLDGGQILQSLLWFIMGRGRSLMIATAIGFIGALGFIVFAVLSIRAGNEGIWLIILGIFMILNCRRGWAVAGVLSKLDKAPRRPEFHCPVCQASPPAGLFWRCGKCAAPFDTFETHARCPNCGEQFGVTACFSCGKASPIDQWVIAPIAPPLPSERPAQRPPPLA